MCKKGTIGLPYEDSQVILRYGADDTRDNPGGKMVTPGMASAKEGSLDNDDERVNSCLACDARQVTLDGKMLSIVTGANASVWG